MEQDQLDKSPRPAAGAPPPDSPPGTAAAPQVEEATRPSVADRLSAQLDIGLALLEKCELLSVKTTGDKLRPIHAATRLMQANTGTGRALTQLEYNEASLAGIVQRMKNLGTPPAEMAAPAMSIAQHYVDATYEILAYRTYQLASEEGIWYDPKPSEPAPYVPPPLYTPI